MSSIFKVRTLDVQPTQLYISEDKLRSVDYALRCCGSLALAPIPVVRWQDRLILTEGHTRALALYLLGEAEIRVCWETESIDWEMYRSCLNWCAEAGIHSVADLSQRVVSHADFCERWIGLCERYYQTYCVPEKPIPLRFLTD